MSSDEVHFAQHLACNEKRIRDKALARLRKWIRLRSAKEESEFTQDGMMKLWKGLFYCMWMADKPLIQEELADNISSLVHSFSKPSQSYMFIDAFMNTMGRNHDHIDKYRIDKFLMLARRFLRGSFQYLKSHEWQHKHVQKYLNTLRETILSKKQESKEMALGFRLHMFDVFLEELARVAEGELPQKRAHNFLEPFYEVLTYCKSPLVVEGIRDKIFYQLVKLNAAGLEDDEVESEDEDEEKVTGRDFLDEEAELDPEADEDASSDEEEEEKPSKRRKVAKDFFEDEEENEEETGDVDEEGNAEEGDLEENLILDEEAVLSVQPIDFNMTAIKESLIEFSKVNGIKSLNRRTIDAIVRKIIDLESGVNPFAITDVDSGSDLELTAEELKNAEKRLRLLEKQYAEDAENYLIPDKEEGEDEDEFEMEGGEDDAEEFERTFVESNGTGKRSKKRARADSDDEYGEDSDDEHFGEIEKDIQELKVKEKFEQLKAKLGVNGEGKSPKHKKAKKGAKKMNGDSKASPGKKNSSPGKKFIDMQKSKGSKKVLNGKKKRKV